MPNPGGIPDTKTLIRNVVATFENESKRKRPVVGFHMPMNRAAKIQK